MLPHKRNEASLKSVPVSRVSSSQRLNQLAAQPNAYASIPSTPSAYVTSSLNPSRHLPITPGNIKSKITNKEELDKFEKLPVVQHVNQLEKLLNDLSSDISSFKDEAIVETISDIIHTNNQLKANIDGLGQHRELGEEIKQLTGKQTDLNNQSKHILIELIGFRNELKKLPRLPAAAPAKNVPEKEKVEVSLILKYAMKLAKFTKAPATVGNAPFQIHPNNYVWPAEDALRRGMLAASSLKEDEIIKNELNDGKTPEKDVEAEVEDVPVLDDPVQAEKKSTGRRSSFGEYGKEDVTSAPVKKDESADLDLDLFDPDDEFSD